MPCTPCEQKKIQLKKEQARQSSLSAEYKTQANADCEYTGELLDSWRGKLKCIKESNLFEQVGVSKAQLNSHIGIVLSSLNYRHNFCKFSTQLESIKVLIYKLAELNLC